MTDMTTPTAPTPETEPELEPAPGPVGDPTAVPVAVEPVHRHHRGRKVAAVLTLVLIPVLLLAGAAGGLAAWDAGYEGRILPGVNAGTADLSGLDRAAAAAAITAAYPYQDGRVVVRTPDGDVAIAYADIGRRADVDAMVDQAMASGRAGTIAERTVAEIRQALDGTTIEPVAVFDAAALSAAVEAAVVGPRSASRYSAASAAESVTPSLVIRSLAGSQMRPSDPAVLPPARWSASTTSTRSPSR